MATSLTHAVLLAATWVLLCGSCADGAGPEPPGSARRFDELIRAMEEDPDRASELDSFLEGLDPEERLALAEHAAGRGGAHGQVAVRIFLDAGRVDRAAEVIVAGLRDGEDLLSAAVFSALHTDPESVDALLAAVREEIARREPEMTEEERDAVARIVDEP